MTLFLLFTLGSVTVPLMKPRLKCPLYCSSVVTDMLFHAYVSYYYALNATIIFLCCTTIVIINKGRMHLFYRWHEYILQIERLYACKNKVHNDHKMSSIFSILSQSCQLNESLWVFLLKQKASVLRKIKYQWGWKYFLRQSNQTTIYWSS